VNARVRYIEGDMEEAEYAQWAKNFDTVPEPLTAEDKSAFRYKCHRLNNNF